jgi:hypothetical protein
MKELRGKRQAASGLDQKIDSKQWPVARRQVAAVLTQPHDLQHTLFH